MVVSVQLLRSSNGAGALQRGCVCSLWWHYHQCVVHATFPMFMPDDHKCFLQTSGESVASWIFFFFFNKHCLSGDLVCIALCTCFMWMYTMLEPSLQPCFLSFVLFSSLCTHNLKVHGRGRGHGALGWGKILANSDHHISSVTCISSSKLGMSCTCIWM